MKQNTHFASFCFTLISRHILAKKRKIHLKNDFSQFWITYHWTNYHNFLFRLCRCLSSLQEERVRASGILRGPDKNAINRIDNKTEFVEKIRLALYASKIVSYAQVNQQNVLQIGHQNSNSNYFFRVLCFWEKQLKTSNGNWTTEELRWCGVVDVSSDQPFWEKSSKNQYNGCQ